MGTLATAGRLASSKGEDRKHNWEIESVSLRFLLGELCLRTVSFPAAVWDASVNTFDDSSPSHIHAPFDALPTHVTVAKLVSFPLTTRLPRITLLPDSIRYAPAQYDRFYIALQGTTFEEYLAHFSSKSRSTLRRKIRRFADASGGAIRWREFSQTNEVSAFYELARQVSAKSYQEKLLGVGMPEGADVVSQMERTASAGAMRGYILYFADAPIAYLYCPIVSKRVLYQHVGYDPAYRDWSPGTVLLYLVLERLFSEHNLEWFDFTEGEGTHKQYFATRKQYCADIYFFRKHLSAALFVLAHSLTHSVSRLLVKVTERIGIKAALKNWLRHRR